MNYNKIYLFICECPRSGTTAFARYLTSHKSGQFAIFIERYGKYWGKNNKFPEDAFSKKRVSTIIEGDTFYDTLDISKVNLIALNNLENAKFVGDKIPLLRKNFKSLYDQFPNAKVFYLFRDPFGVANSYKQRALNNEDTNWGAHRDVFFALLEWNESLKALVDFFNSESKFFDKIYILEFDKFCSNSFCKKELNLFLQSNLEFPSNFHEKEFKVYSYRDRKKVILDLVDFSILKEVQKIINTQRLIYYNLCAPKAKYYSYYKIDKELLGIDYGEFLIDDCPYVFRGRKRPVTQKYVSVLGSDITFGRFVKKPFVTKLDEYAEKRNSNISFINLGISHSRPSTYLSSPSLLNFISKSEMIIIESMSARGYINPIWEPISTVGEYGYLKIPFRFDNQKIKDDHNLSSILEEMLKEEVVSFKKLEMLLNYISEEQVLSIFNIIRKHYIDDLFLLIDLFDKPIIFLYVTERINKYILNKKTNFYNYCSDKYPHFVDQIITDLLRNKGFPVIDIIIPEGLTQIFSHYETEESVIIPTLIEEIHDVIFSKILNHSYIKSLINGR